MALRLLGQKQEHQQARRLFAI